MTAIYRLVVRLAFPRRVRRRFGADMVRMFEQQLAADRAGGGSAVSLFMNAVADACLEGLGERLAIVVECRRAAGVSLDAGGGGCTRFFATRGLRGGCSSSSRA